MQKEFIKDKIISLTLMLFAIATIEIYLLAYQVGGFIRIYTFVIIILMYFAGILIEYFIKSRYYKNLEKTVDELDEKYLITEIIKNANFWEGKILKNSLEQIDKSMVENVNKYKYMRRGL